MTDGARAAGRDARGVAINFLTLAAQASLPAFHVQLARLLGAEDYGLYVLANTWVDLLSVLTLFGMDTAVMRRVSVAHDARAPADAARHTGAALRVVLATGVAAGALLALAAPVIAAWARKPGLVVPLRVLAWVPVAYHAASVFLVATQAKRVMHWDFWARGIFQPLCLLALTSVLLRTHGGLLGACTAVAVGMALTAGLAAVFYGREFALNATLHAVARPVDRSLLRLGWPLMLTNLLWTLQGRLEVILMGRYGASLDAGAYGACMLYVVSLTQVRGAFVPVVSAAVAPALARGDVAGLTATLQRQVRWVAVLAMPLAVLFAGFGDGLLAVFGRDFVGAAPALTVLALAHLWSALALPAYVLPLGGHARYSAVAALVGAVLQCVLLPTLVPRHGLLGAAVSAGTALVVAQGMQLAMAWRLVRVHGFSWGLAKVTLAAGLGFAVGRGVFVFLHGALAVRFFAGVGAALGVYLTVLVALGLTDEERALLAGAWSRARALRRG